MKFVEQTILLVDDDTAITEFLQDVLEIFGCTIKVAHYGREALDLAHAFRPDLVLLDIMLPDMDGYTVCSELKNDPATKDASIIFLTAISDKEQEASGLEIGAYDYITKPFLLTVLRARVQTQLELKQHRDKLDRLVAERTKELHEKEKKYFQLAHEFKSALNAFQDIVFVASPQKTINWANECAAKNAGETLSSLVDKDCCIICPAAPPCPSCLIEETLRASSPQTGRQTSTSLKTWEMRTFPVCDITGHVVSVVVDCMDITEKIKLEAKVIRNAHLASLGIMSAGLVHEIENPNHFMSINADMAEKICSDLLTLSAPTITDADKTRVGGVPFAEAQKIIAELFQGIRQGAERIKNISDGLLRFARQDVLCQKENVSLNTVTENAAKFVSYLLKKTSTALKLELSPDSPHVSGNGCQLEQVLINLIQNSTESMTGNRRNIVIKTAVAAKNNAIITVTDTGSGISQENLASIFKPFYTTKLNSGGTGLGLFIARTIISDHHGELFLDSEPGIGTTATIILPELISSVNLKRNDTQ